MCDSVTQLMFFVFGGLMLLIGIYCAHKFNKKYPCWVRLIVLGPAVVCAFLIYHVVLGECVINPLVTALVTSIALLYALVASRLSDNPWLDLRVSK